MIEVFAAAGPLLAQSGGVVRDTVYLLHAPAPRGVLDQIVGWATAIITLSLLGLAIFAIPALWRFRRTYRKVEQLVGRIGGDITPITHHARAISENIDFVTTAIRADVAKVSATIDAANDRVNAAMADTERRVKEFNALLSVVQEEAENLFLSTASTVRGVKRGAAELRGRGGMDLASDELDAADAAEDLELEEDSDGDDSSTQSAAEALPAAPRVRPRPGTRRRA